MKLVLTEVDLNREEQVYKQAKVGLAKYLMDGSSQATAFSGGAHDRGRGGAGSQGLIQAGHMQWHQQVRCCRLRQ